jgi:uncharacterized protein YcbK (DUF882 family)
VRSNFLKWLTSSLCLVVLSLVAVSKSTASMDRENEYELRLFNTHNGKRLDIVYRRGTSYIPEALAELDSYMKDRWTGDIRHFDPRVFDLLHDLQAKVGRPDSQIDIVCGYRSPSSNEFLRAHGHKVAQHSLHMQALAIDIRIPGISTSRLRDAALSLHRGGVGYYADSEFVHVDVGRVRRW